MAEMNLFDFMRSNTMERESPLASRMRPTSLDEVVGQKHIIGKDKLLYRAIKAGLRHLLRSSGNREDDSGKGHSQHHQSRF